MNFAVADHIADGRSYGHDKEAPVKSEEKDAVTEEPTAEETKEDTVVKAPMTRAAAEAAYTVNVGEELEDLKAVAKKEC